VISAIKSLDEDDVAVNSEMEEIVRAVELEGATETKVRVARASLAMLRLAR
jgi:hypothetical protein